MKKFISFVMAGAMVASLVPATAFAKGEVTATAKVVDALEKAKDFGGVISGTESPELQLKVTSVDYLQDYTNLPTMTVEITLDNAELNTAGGSAPDDDVLLGRIKIIDDENGANVFDKTATKDTDIKGGAVTTTYEEKTVAGSDISDAKTAGATGIAKDSTGKNYVALDDIEGTPGMTIDEQKAALEAAGYAQRLVSGDLKYVLLNADGSVKDIKEIPAAVVAPKTADDVYAEMIAAGYKNYKKETSSSTGSGARIWAEVTDKSKDSVEFKFHGRFVKDDKLVFELASKMTKTSEGTKATVSVDSKMVTVDDLVYASVLGKGFKASVKKTVDVAEDERVVLNSSGLKIEAAVGNLPKEVTLKINNGFEFTDRNNGLHGTGYTIAKGDDDKELIVTVADGYEDITIKDIEIEAVSAKSGAVATITAKASNNDSASCEVAKVVDYKVSLTVDADEDLPVIYSGVNQANAGITDDSDHLSLEVTAKESFPGAWSMRQGFNFNLPEGVYVTDVKNIDAENFFQDGRNLDKEGSKTDSSFNSDKAWQQAFFNAYQDGDHKNFEFKKRVFDDVNTNVTDNDPAEITFQLELVADPTFEGDVKLTLEGPLVDKQEVTIAKFVKPYTVKAEQNDVIIDYRNTEVKTPIVITEAEEGLWRKDATFKLNIEDDLLTFEDDPTFTIDKDSDLKLKDDKTTKGTIQFAIKEESDKAASVTISDMKLFMSRSIPAGAYDLEISTTMSEAYDKQLLFAPDAIASYVSESAYDSAITNLAKKDGWKNGDRDSNTVKKDSYVDDVCDYSDVVKAAFINVVTSGRDNDNLFTTKVVVPVGEAYLLAGEAKVELDAPAYISAAGYTMLPVRAISKALGVNTNNVLWNAETRTVTVMYAQRIITMTVGQKTIYVNGSAIPASAAPEIKDGRTFLPLRDLGTALGVTNVNWDAATKTATLN